MSAHRDAQRQYESSCDCCSPQAKQAEHDELLYQDWCRERSDGDMGAAMIGFLESRGLFEGFEAWDAATNWRKV